NHSFIGFAPLLVVGMYAKVEGCRTSVVESGERVDLLFGSAGITLGARRLGRWLPLVRLREGFVLADGAPGGLAIQGRIAAEPGAGLRYRITDWLLARAEADAVLHDNLQLGAGSGEVGEAVHTVLVAGFSVIR